MSMGIIAAGVVAVGAVASSEISANAAQSAAATQAASAQAANQIQTSEFAQQQANLAPWVQAGTNALGVLQQGAMPGGQFNTPFTLGMFQQSPGYNFQKAQGQAAINAAGAAGGQTFSPATTQALIGFNQGAANTEYQQALGNYTNQVNGVLGQEQTLANAGQSSTNNLDTLGGTNAQTIGSNLIGAGNSAAAAKIGSANATTTAITGAGQQFLNSTYMNKLLGKNTTTTPDGTPTDTSPAGYAGPDALGTGSPTPLSTNFSTPTFPSGDLSLSGMMAG